VFGVPEHGRAPFGFAQLHGAWLRCRRGKGNARARWGFEFRLEANLLELAQLLQSRRYRPLRSVCFLSDQPKKREIFAAAFRDRVVHHLVVGAIEPWWEQRFIHDSYACRRGKGTLAAIERAQQYIRQVSANGSRRAWALHLDIRSYFVSIDKARLVAMLERGIRRQGLAHAEDWIYLVRTLVWRDPAADALCLGSGLDTVPAHKSLFHTGNRTGLPIGNYSSQFFANVYLDRLDQFIKHTLKARHYLRYVDDLALFHTDRAVLEDWEARIGVFLRDQLALELNPRSRRLVPVSQGVDVLGQRVWAHHRELRRRTVRRFARHLLNAEQKLWPIGADGTRPMMVLPEIAADRLLSQCMSYRGFLLNAGGQRTLQQLQHRHPWLQALWRLLPGGRCRRRDRPACAPPGRLALQWRGLKRLWPRARVLLQVGRFWEAWGADAQWLRRVLGLAQGRRRPGMPRLAAGFPSAQTRRHRPLLLQRGQPLVWVAQTGRRHGALRERRVIRIDHPAPLLGAGHRTLGLSLRERFGVKGSTIYRRAKPPRR
jgi:hypothetical protein